MQEETYIWMKKQTRQQQGLMYYWLGHPSSLRLRDHSGNVNVSKVADWPHGTHASGSGSGSGFSKKVFLMKSNGCKRNQKDFQNRGGITKIKNV
jgi:hypothetical protein